jgi:predicted AlkP superfamily phosphohydrolase/phosphomutase
LGVDAHFTCDPAWTRAMHRALRAIDTAVGELLELAHRRQAAVVLLSDHGFGAFRERIAVPTLLSQIGALRAATRLERHQYRFSRSLWKLRRWSQRALRGQRPVAAPRPATALAPIDWRRSLVVPLHGALGAMLYLNRPERFGHGPLTSQRLCDEALAKVVAGLTAARHPNTGEPLFAEVMDTSQQYGIDPLETNWPDLVAIPAPGFHTRVKCDRSENIVLSDSEMAGTHRAEGVLMVSAPAAGPASGFEAELRDVAPTILRLLGGEVPAAMSGRVLQQVVGRAAVSAQTSSTSQPRRGGSQDMSTAAEDDDAVTARLRDLGYID